ncbi:iron ABC transporter permease [Candidatus Thorarchaeota archaeon]|nr:MAG: iron ABC transporter permease [Candidatus Thorarchaeota archaeon]
MADEEEVVKKKNRLVKYLVLGTPFSILFAFLVFPVFTVVVEGILGGGVDSLITTIGSPTTNRVFTFTIGQAIISTAASFLLGIPGAFVFARMEFPGRNIVRALFVVPFVLPPIVVVVGFMQVFGSGGILDSILKVLLQSSDSVLNLATGAPGIILAHAFYNAPLFIMMVSSSLKTLPEEMEEIAESLGASRTGILRRIIFPHIRSSLFAASILTFLFCFMSFPIVLAFGQGRLMTLEVQIWNAFRFFEYDKASILAFIQILITLVLAYSYVRTETSTSGYADVKSRVRELAEIGTKWKLVTISYISFALFLLMGPMLAIFLSAVHDPFRDQFTLDGLAYLMQGGLDGGLVPLFNSLFYGGLATLLSLLLGIPLAYVHKSKRFMLPGITSVFTLLPLGISSITMAYGLMLAVAVPLGLTTNPWPLIIIAQTIIGVPFSARSIQIAWEKVNEDVLDQADILGASRMQKLFFVELPLLAPGILVAAVFSFAMAIGEMSATLFLAQPENSTLSVAIYRNLAVRNFVQAGASALILVLICLVAFLVIEYLSESGYGGAL